MIHVDQRAHKVFVDGEEVHLAPKEFNVLAILAEDPGAVVTRLTLVDRVWGLGSYPHPKSLDAHIRFIRRKIGHERIECVHRVGYRLAA